MTLKDEIKKAGQEKRSANVSKASNIRRSGRSTLNIGRGNVSKYSKAPTTGRVITESTEIE